MGHIAIGLRPEGIGELIDGDLPASKCNQGLQQGQGFFLGLAGKYDRRFVPEQFKPTQGMNLYRPGPVIQMQGRFFRDQPFLADKLAGIAYFDTGLQRFDTKPGDYW
jgi:hypothetical protein